MLDRTGPDAPVEVLEPWTIGRSLNFLYGEVTADELRLAYEPDAYRKLSEVRTANRPAR